MICNVSNSIAYIIFMLNNEEYGIEISYAREIIRFPSQITLIPNMPSHVEGVINLRGNVIPVIDLKKKFEFAKSDKPIEGSRLLIIDFQTTVIAVIVDDVTEIINIQEDTIENMNVMMSNIGQNNLKGIGKIDDRLILLLDVTKLKTEIFKRDLKLEEQL